MAKVKLTRPEMKRQRDALGRFQRYLPMLKLKQQQLQLMVRQAQQKLTDAQRELDAAEAAFDPYRRILADRAGVNLADSRCQLVSRLLGTTRSAAEAVGARSRSDWRNANIWIVFPNPISSARIPPKPYSRKKCSQS